MIPQVRSVIKLVSEYLGDGVTPFPIVRKEQSGRKPIYPYAGYKITSLNGQPYINQGQIENLDPTKVTYHHTKEETAIVSLSFYTLEKPDQPSIDKIYVLANKAIEYLQLIGKDQIRDLQLVVELFDTTVQDRTLYLDTVYEYQIGFDFKVRGLKVFDQELDAVDVGGTIAGIEYNYE